MHFLIKQKQMTKISFMHMCKIIFNIKTILSLKIPIKQNSNNIWKDTKKYIKNESD